MAARTGPWNPALNRSIGKAKAQGLAKDRDVLVESVRTHLLPVLIQREFAAGSRVGLGPTDEKSADTFPFGLFRRVRPDGGVDLVEIQFSTYQRPAFRINACAVPKEGLLTVGGHRTAEELDAGGLHDHFVTHARAWLRPGLRALGLEPLAGWYSLRLWRRRSANQADYDRLALEAANVVPEIELALSQGRVGPHILKIVIPGGT